MTNLTQLTIALIVSTNWLQTFTPDNKLELGYVKTSHLATVTYQGKATTVELKADIGSTLMFRPRLYFWGWTNGELNTLSFEHALGDMYDVNIRSNTFYYPPHIPKTQIETERPRAVRMREYPVE